jgi:hypothetical protein
MSDALKAKVAELEELVGRLRAANESMARTLAEWACIIAQPKVTLPELRREQAREAQL